MGTLVGSWPDRALDQIQPARPGDPPHQEWSIIALREPSPEARVVAKAREIADRPSLVNRLSRADDRDVAWFLAEDHVPARPDGQSARLVSWDGTRATIEHQGTCDLVIARTFDQGWHARIGRGPEQPVLPVDGGLLAVRVEGSGTDRVRLRYYPPQLSLFAATSLVALSLVAAVLVAALVAWARSTMRGHAWRAITG